jgi:hypothetical protein
MPLVKTSVTIPDDVLSEAKKVSDNFSSLVTVALKEYLRRKNVEKAVASFGKWKGRDKASVEIVRELRKEEGRKYAKRSR